MTEIVMTYIDTATDNRYSACKIYNKSLSIPFFSPCITVKSVFLLLSVCIFTSVETFLYTVKSHPKNSSNDIHDALSVVNFPFQIYLHDDDVTPLHCLFAKVFEEEDKRVSNIRPSYVSVFPTQ